PLPITHLPFHLALALHQAVHAAALLSRARSTQLLVDVRRDLALGLGELLGRAHRVLDAAVEVALLLALQPAARFAQALRRGGGVARGPGLPAGARPAHGIGGVLETPRGVLQRGVRLLARQPLQLPRQVLRLLGQRALAAAASAAGHVRRAARELSLPLGLLLLPLRQLAQALQGLVHLVARLLLLAALHGLVLVLELV